ANNRDIAFELLTVGESREIRPMICYELFRIGSEAIGNAFRHSGAALIRVELTYGNGLWLSVKDNGRGISSATVDRVNGCHLGLQGMRERGGRIGARLDIFRREGEGTRMELVVPHDIAFDTRRTNRYTFSRIVPSLKDTDRTNTRNDSRS